MSEKIIPPQGKISEAGKPPPMKGPGGGHEKKPAHHDAELHSGSHQEEEGGELWLVSYADMMTLLVGFFVILLSFSTVDEKKFEEVKKAATMQFGGQYQVPYDDVAKRIKAVFEKMGMGDKYIITQTDNGVTISFQGAVFFDSGSADLRNEGEVLLKKLLETLKAEQEVYDVTIEGHTDDVPLASDRHFRNNWELSSVRACRVLDEFEEGGFAKKNLTAVGYGEARPAVPNRDPQGHPIAVNQSQNRRVVIKLSREAESLVGGEAKPAEPHSQ